MALNCPALPCPTVTARFCRCMWKAFEVPCCGPFRAGRSKIPSFLLQPSPETMVSAAMEHLIPLANPGAMGLGDNKVPPVSMADLNRNAMLRFTNDIFTPPEPIESYITEAETRCSLYAKFVRSCEEASVTSNTTVFALFMVAPVLRICHLLDTIHKSRLGGSMVGGIVKHAPRAIRSCTSLSSPPTTCCTNRDVDLSNPDIPSKRSIRGRDRPVCAFSGMPDPTGAPIIPFATSHRHFDSLKHILNVFWGEEQASTWRLRFEEDVSYFPLSPKTVIPMSHQMQFWFDRARFALKPLQETEIGVEVQFHWLKRAQTKPLQPLHCAADSPPLSYLTHAGVTTESWGDGLNLAHRMSGVPIRTGQVFTLRADDPREKPSWELLEMQWNFLRIAAICGAAEVLDDYYNCPDLDKRALDRPVDARHGTPCDNLKRYRVQRLALAG